MSTGACRATIDGLPEIFMQNVVAVLRPARLWIKTLPDVLEDGFLVPEVLPGFAIELPEDAVLADGKDEISSTAVDQHALEHDIEIQRLCGSMLEVPRLLAGVHIDRKGGAAEERVIFRTPRQGHPRLGLRGSPVRQIQHGIIAARNPHLASDAHLVRQVAPGVAAFLAGHGRGVEPPGFLSGRRVVGAQITPAVHVELCTASHAFDDFAFSDDGTARIAMADVCLLYTSPSPR